MASRRVKRALLFIARITMLGHIFDLVYSIVVLVSLVGVIRWLSPYPVLMYIGTVVYVIAAISLYFLVATLLRQSPNDA